MDDFKKFLSTLNDQELHDVKQSLERGRDFYRDKSDRELIDTFIFNILWDYKYKAEMAENPHQARAYEQRKAEVYRKWQELGFVKK